jgi:hypothetical protein
MKLMTRKENDIPNPNCMLYWFAKRKKILVYLVLHDEFVLHFLQFCSGF